MRAPTASNMPELKTIEQSKWGSQLLDTIALQIQNKAPMDKIYAVLNEIITGLQDQQAEEDSAHAAKMAECAREDDRLTNTINEATLAIEGLDARIAELKKEIREGETREGELVHQIDLLEQHIEHSNEVRAKDSADFERRQQETNIAIEAIQDAIVEVEKLVGAEPADVESAIQKLQKIGKSNPILAFAQIASTAD